MDVELCDEWEAGVGWQVADEPVRRTSHALAVDGGVWLVDPVDWAGLDARVGALGAPRGVIQLVDRHARDGAAVSARLGVPLHRVPRREIPGAPFTFVRVADVPTWRETALWWAEGRVLACGDALGTLPYFLAPGETIGVHPLLRAFPPRRLRGLVPERILCGHGTGLHGPGAAPALDEALATARRRLPAAWLNAVRRLR